MNYVDIVNSFNEIKNVKTNGNKVIVIGDIDYCQYENCYTYKHTKVAKEVASKVKMFINI